MKRLLKGHEKKEIPLDLNRHRALSSANHPFLLFYIFWKWQYRDLEIRFWSVKCAFVTRLRKYFEQLSIPSQAVQGDYSVLT